MDIFHSRKVSSEASAKCKDLQQQLAKKNLSQKTEKPEKSGSLINLFSTGRKHIFSLNFYIAALPTMKSYVMLFETKEPLVHKLLDKQEDFYKNCWDSS